MLSELANELLEYVEGFTDVNDRYYEVIDLDDLQKRLESERTRISVSVSYGGAFPTNRDHGARNSLSKSAMMFDIRFHVIVSYWYDTEDSEDTKRKAFDLLDQIRGKVLGQHSSTVNRTWEFLSETPLDSGKDSSTIFYMQTWKVRSSQSSL